MAVHSAGCVPEIDDMDLELGAFGYRVAWVNRAGAPTERLGFLPDFTMPDLSELP